MEALKILKRIAYYLLFIVAATVCFNMLVSLALAPYTDAWGTLSLDLIAEQVYLKVLYVFLSFAIAVVTQACLIKKPSEVESVVYPWLLIAYFGIGAAVSIYVLVRGLISINQEIYNKNPVFLIIPISLVLIFTIAEMVMGVFFLRRSKKEIPDEKEPQALEGEPQVSLHKDEE